jgi:hypothetical protein
MAKVFGILLLTAVAFVGTAQAGSVVLTTPPVLGDRVTCLIANAGSKSITVTVDLVGSTVTINLATETVIDSGGFAAWGAGDDDIAYCRFAIIQGNDAGVRASACGVIANLGDKCGSSADAR